MQSEIKKIGKYEIVSTLGKGAMGIVYKSIDPVIKREVAIKTIHSLNPSIEEETLKERFIQEAQAAGRLHHPNIVAVYEYGEDEKWAFIAMEFIKGDALSSILKRQTQFDVPQACDIMQGILRGLSYAHANGVVHRDIKPSNIMLTEDGSVKLMDFGIARIESSNLTRVGTVLGTPGYMSPEQLVGKQVDHRSDLFSAGVLLYELLTGEMAFDGTSLTSVMYKVVNTKPPPPASLRPDLPIAFNDIVDKALQKDPEERYQTADEFAKAIALIAANLRNGSTGAKTVVRAGTDVPAARRVAVGDEDETVVNLNTRDSAGRPAGAPGTRDDPSKVEMEQPVRVTSGAEAGSVGKKRSYAALVGVLILLGVAAGGWFLVPRLLPGPEIADVEPVPPVDTSTVDRPAAPAPDAEAPVSEKSLAPEVPEKEPATAGRPEVEVEKAPAIQPLRQELIVSIAGEARREPLKDSQQVAALSEGERVSVTGQVVDGDWYRITNQDGEDSFVPKAMLRELRASDLYRPGESIIDCHFCPELVVIPSGSATIGSPVVESSQELGERPQHLVTIDYMLAVGRYEVTKEQYRRFSQDTGYRAEGCKIYANTWRESPDNSWSDPGFEQQDSHPATCISWNDAKAYVRWLSEKTNQPYRLPSSSEWEYVARAGASGPRYWGEEKKLACRYGNVADDTAENTYAGWQVHKCDDKFVHTAPVGSFSPNEFGVYDVLGNAFEWVEDCWNKDYQEAPVNGEPWTSGDCGQRVLRGGSWYSMPKFVRSAFRNRFHSDERSSTFGFRVARSLDN